MERKARFEPFFIVMTTSFESRFFENDNSDKKTQISQLFKWNLVNMSGIDTKCFQRARLRIENFSMRLFLN